MRVTIIPADGFVSIDGLGYSGLDLSAIDQTVHAVQWSGDSGEVEMKDAVTGMLVANAAIDSLDDYQTAIDQWNAAHASSTAAQQGEPFEQPAGE